MKKYIVFFYLILLNFANSEQKIAYIDMKKILNTSSAGINLTNKKLSSLKNKVERYNKDKNNSLNNLNKIKIDKTSNLINKINPIIANYASDKNISIIIRKDSMIMGKTELDISSDIINLINKDIKE